MSKTFDQAVYEKTGFDLYSSRNIRYDDLVSLIDDLNLLKNQTSYTRTAKGQLFNLKARSDTLISKLREDNEALHAALFKINPKIQDNLKYKQDQTEVRKWIKDLETANFDLQVKLEDENAIPIHTEAPPAASDVATILQQMSKQQADI